MLSQPPRNQNRLELIDFLRGVAIVEMVVTHFSIYLPHIIEKFVDYTETAMALFVLVAGFMVGWDYPKFERNPTEATEALWIRGIRVFLVQCIIIVTVGIPLFLLSMPEVNTNQSLIVFVLQSLTFQNQIGVIHILPTFVPLFAISPVILFAMSKERHVLVLFVSLGLFLIGHYHPQILDIGQPTKFPFVLFQLYFVVGCVVGNHAQLTGSLAPSHANRWLLASCAALFLTMTLVHGKFLPSGLVSTHPLNLFGLLYHGPIILTLCLFSIVFWRRLLWAWWYPYVSRFGRHALLAFVIHLYFAKAIAVLNVCMTIPATLNYVFVLVSVVVMNGIVSRYEMAEPRHNTRVWARALYWLFR